MRSFCFFDDFIVFPLSLMSAMLFFSFLLPQFKAALFFGFSLFPADLFALGF